jgi:uncharacterized membrane protein
MTKIAPPALLALAVLLYAIYFSWLTIERYHAFESRALDMGNLHQAIWNTAHGDWFRMTNQEEGLTSRLSMHVEPILLPIAGIYRLLPGVETLLVIQATVVALGALPLYALARRRGLGDWTALVFAVAWLLNPTIQAANWLEFHPVTLAPTFLMAAFYFLVSVPPTPRGENAKGGLPGRGSSRKGVFWFAIFAILAAACKEEIGLLVAMMGLYAALFLGRRRLGLITFALGAGWSLLAVLGIQAAFAGGNIHWGRYAYLGETTGAKLLSLVTRPDLVFSQLQSANIGRYFFELLLPVGFLSLLAPEVLLLALPSLAINLLAQFSPMHQVTTLIYAAPVIPFVLLSAVMGSARSLEWVVRRVGPPPIEIEGYATAKPTAVGWAATRVNDPNRFQPVSHELAAGFNRRLGWRQAALCLYILAFALLGQRLYGYLPGSGNAMPLAVTAHHQAAQAIIDWIPPEAAVSAQDRLNPHVAGRRTVYIFPRVEDAGYVLLDVTGSAWPQHPNDLRRTVDDLLQAGFGVAAAADGYLLLGKGLAGQALDPAFYTAWMAGEESAPAGMPVGAQFGSVATGDALQLEEYLVRSDRYGELVVDLTWRAPQPLDHDLRFYVAFLDTLGNVLHDNIYYQPVPVLWYPTSMWPAAGRVRVSTLPWQLDASQFVLAVGVFSGEEGWTSGARLPVTDSAGLPVLEDGTLLRLGGFARAGTAGWDALTTLPEPFAALPLQPVDVPFDGALWLRAAGLPAHAKAGQSLPLRLVWERAGAPPPNLVRFVHLLDAGGNKVAQVDGQVIDALGPLPLAAWAPGAPVDDLVTLALPAELSPGDYTLVAGWYDWQSGARLPAAGEEARPDDAAALGSVQIQP